MKKRLSIFLILYFVGFTIGILCTSLLKKVTQENTALLGIYLKNQNTESVLNVQVFGHLLKLRGKWFLFYFIGGMTPAGIVMVLAGCLWLGLLAGCLVTLFLMEYGVIGIFFCIGCGIPLIFFYLPSVLALFFLCSEMSLKFWRKSYRRKEDYKGYVFFMTSAALIFLLGIFLESYVSPNLLRVLFH